MVNRLFFLVVGAVCLMIVSAYDFSEPDFNQMLFNEFRGKLFKNENSDNSVINRSRREALDVQKLRGSPKHGGHGRGGDCFMCCKNNNTSDDHFQDAFKKVKDQCLTEVFGGNADESYDPFDCKKMQSIKEKMVCVHECAMKKVNSIDRTGGLKRDEILTGLRPILANVQWKADAIESYVDKCLGEVSAMKYPSSTNNQCSQAPLDFHYCMWREFFKGCPLELRIDSPSCIRARDRINKGDTASALNRKFLFKIHHNQLFHHKHGHNMHSDEKHQ